MGFGPATRQWLRQAFESAGLSSAPETGPSDPSLFLDDFGALTPALRRLLGDPDGSTSEAELRHNAHRLSLLPPGRRPPELGKLLAAVYHASRASRAVAGSLDELVRRLSRHGSFDIPAGATGLLVDLGCGTGNLLEAMRRTAEDWTPRISGELIYVGVDPDGPRLQLLQRVAEDLRTETALPADRLRIEVHRDTDGCGPPSLRPYLPAGGLECVTITSVNRDREANPARPAARDQLPAPADWYPVYRTWSRFQSRRGTVAAFVHTVTSRGAADPENPFAPVVAEYRALVESRLEDGAAVLYPCPSPGRGCWRRGLTTACTRRPASNPWAEAPVCYGRKNRRFLELDFALVPYGVEPRHAWRFADRFQLDGEAICLAEASS